MEVINRK